MKKTVFVLLIMLLSNPGLKAQTWDEWFNQSSTQKKYLKQQIIALQVYINYAKEGYKIAKEGLSTIGKLSKGEFDLHNSFFNSLKIVNPSVKNYGRVREIISIQVHIVSGWEALRSKVNSSHHLSASEKDYLIKVYQKLIADCENVLEELITVVSNQSMEMTDSERIERIDVIHRDMVDKMSFYENFTADTKMLIANRAREENQVKDSRLRNGLNQ